MYILFDVIAPSHSIRLQINRIDRTGGVPYVDGEIRILDRLWTRWRPARSPTYHITMLIKHHDAYKYARIVW